MDTLEQYLKDRPDDTRPPLLSPGTVVGLWKICALIAHGGSGEVYRAEDTQDGSVAAVKVLFRTDEASRRRFLREIKIFASNKSDAFPRLFGNGELNGHQWYAMELLEPCELPRTDRTVADFLLNLCAGVAELHRLGYVHRDIKPANVMRRADGACVLIDLGLVKPNEQPPVAKGASISIVDGRAVGLGTVGYAAPEQLVGGGVSTASDIHALGVLANTCFHDNPPRAWKRIILRATSSLPDYRYRTVDEFICAINKRHTFRNCLTGAFLAVILLLIAVVANRLNFTASTEETPALKPSAITHSLGMDVVELATNALPSPFYLHGKAYVLNRPVRLKEGEKLTIVGPGRLEADISGENGSCLSLTNCVVMNFTYVPFEKSGIKYELLNGVYLNFVNLSEPFPAAVRRFNQFGEKLNKVNYRGPQTLEELQRQQFEKNQKLLMDRGSKP